MVTKKQIAHGLVKFIENDLIPNVGDRNMKFVLAMAKDSLKENNDLVIHFLHSPMISTLITESDGEYDISQFSSILKSVLEEYQTYPVTIPKIPLFSPTEKTIKITADDVDKLLKYVALPENSVM